MLRPLLLVLPIVLAAPTAGMAQDDYCAVLNSTLAEAVEARSASIDAQAAVQQFHRRLQEDRNRYTEQAAEITGPRQDVGNAVTFLNVVVRDLTAIREVRCPGLPDGR